MAHDLVVAKLCAGREKDYVFAQALIQAGLIRVAVLDTRIDLLHVPGGVKRRIRDSIPRACPIFADRMKIRTDVANICKLMT